MGYSAMVLTSIPCCQVSSSSDTVTHLSSSSPRTRTRWPSEVEVSSSEDVCSSSSQQSEDQEEEGSVNRSSVARGEHVKGDVSSQALQGRTTCQPVAQFCEGNGPSHILKHKPQDYLCRWP